MICPKCNKPWLARGNQFAGTFQAFEQQCDCGPNLLCDCKCHLNSQTIYCSNCVAIHKEAETGAYEQFSV